jgi:hypothetical protein
VDVEAPGGGSWNVPNWGESGLHNKPAGCGASETYASGPGRVNVNLLQKYMKKESGRAEFMYKLDIIHLWAP